MNCGKAPRRTISASKAVVIEIRISTQLEIGFASTKESPVSHLMRVWLSAAVLTPKSLDRCSSLGELVFTSLTHFHASFLLPREATRRPTSTQQPRMRVRNLTESMSAAFIAKLGENNCTKLDHLCLARPHRFPAKKPRMTLPVNLATLFSYASQASEQNQLILPTLKTAPPPAPT